MYILKKNGLFCGIAWKKGKRVKKKSCSGVAFEGKQIINSLLISARSIDSSIT